MVINLKYAALFGIALCTQLYLSPSAVGLPPLSPVVKKTGTTWAGIMVLSSPHRYSLRERRDPLVLSPRNTLISIPYALYLRGEEERECPFMRSIPRLPVMTGVLKVNNKHKEILALREQIVCEIEALYGGAMDVEKIYLGASAFSELTKIELQLLIEAAASSRLNIVFTPKKIISSDTK